MDGEAQMRPESRRFGRHSGRHIVRNRRKRPDLDAQLASGLGVLLTPAISPSTRRMGEIQPALR